MEQIRVVAWAREMRRVHQRLADALVVARESIEAGAVEGEDTALFPRLVERHPELAEAVGHLSRDHRMIRHLLGGLRHSMSSDDPPAPPGPAARSPDECRVSRQALHAILHRW